MHKNNIFKKYKIEFIETYKSHEWTSESNSIDKGIKI